MRHVVYECDVCHRQYNYKIKVNEKDRSILAKIPELTVEVCRQCLKKIHWKLVEMMDD